jgi:large subunit ribosomal protein L31e
MAKVETKTKGIEREYVIPLRREWMKVPRYKRTAKSVKAIKEFVAKHMRVPDRDTSKVKLDVYLNNEIWFRGVKKPPVKVRVKVRKEGEIVKVDFVEVPEIVRFAKARHAKMHKKIEKKKEEPKKEDKKKDEKTDEDRKKESEKEKSVEKAQTKLAEKAARDQKHITSSKGGPQIHRKALKK